MGSVSCEKINKRGCASVPDTRLLCVPVQSQILLYQIHQITDQLFGTVPVPSQFLYEHRLRVNLIANSADCHNSHHLPARILANEIATLETSIPIQLSTLLFTD